jgi:hypothetical protein
MAESDALGDGVARRVECIERQRHRATKQGDQLRKLGHIASDDRWATRVP